MRTIALAVALLGLAACSPPGPQKAPEPPPALAPAEPPPQEPASAPDAATQGGGPADDMAAADAAVEARYTPHYQHCMATGEAAQGVTSAMAACVGEELRLQDGALNAEYQRVMTGLVPDAAQALRVAQRQWIKDRDAKCAAAASSGGTIDRINGPACHLDETVRRILELEKMGPG